MLVLQGFLRMISIRNSISDLNRCHELRAITLECYRAAITDSAEYAIVVDHGITGSYRKDLAALAEEIRTAPAEELPGKRVALRHLLEEYSGQAARYLAEKESDLASRERALQEILASLQQADDDHDGRIRATLARLRAISISPLGKSLREPLRAAADAIEASMEKIRKEHQRAITQMQSEIRRLQYRIDPAQAIAGSDSLTKVFSRGEIQARIRSSTPGEFSLVLLRARGLRLAEVQFDPEVAIQLAAAFVTRLRNTLPATAAIGRWNEEEFIALITSPIPAATSLGKAIMESLPGAYACIQQEETVRPSLQVSVGVVESGPQDAPQQLLERVETFFTRV
jgi:GGDEF domain-containing protein